MARKDDAPSSLREKRPESEESSDRGASIRRSTAVGTLQNLAAQAVALATGFATTVFLTRKLGPDPYGEYSVAFGIVMWFEIVVVSLLGSTTVRLVAEADDWERASSSLAQIQLLISLVAAALLLVGARMISAGLNSPGLAPYLRLFAVEIPLFALGRVHRSTLIGQRAFRQGAIVTGVYWLSRLGLMLLLVGLGLSVTGAILANIAAWGVHLIAARVFVRPALLGRPALGIPLRRIAGYALPLALNSMGMLLVTKGDLLIVKAAGRAPGAAGFYSAANDLAMVPVSYLVGSFTSLLLATLTHMWENSQCAGAQSMARRALRLTLCLLPFAGLAAGSASEVICLVYGNSYRPASALFALLIFAAVGYAVIAVAAQTVTARGLPRLVLASSVPMVAVSLAAYLILTPRFGALGTAAGRTSATALGAVMLVGVMTRTCEVRLSLATVGRIGLTTAIAYAVSSVWQTSGGMAVLELMLLSAAVVGLLFLLGELTQKDLRFALSLLRTRRCRADLNERTQSWTN